MAQKVKETKKARRSANARRVENHDTDSKRIRTNSTDRTAFAEEPERESRISSKNQVTIPVATMRELGLRPGDSVLISADFTGAIRIRSAKQSPTDIVDRLAGSLTGVYPPNYLEDLRKDWDGRP